MQGKLKSSLDVNLQFLKHIYQLILLHFKDIFVGMNFNFNKQHVTETGNFLICKFSFDRPIYKSRHFDHAYLNCL